MYNFYETNCYKINKLFIFRNHGLRNLRIFGPVGQDNRYVDIIDTETKLVCIPLAKIMVSMLASSAVDRGFEPRSGQTKDYKIGIWCFSAKHTAFRRKSKDWLESG